MHLHAVAVEVKSLEHWCEELARLPLLHQPGSEPAPQRLSSSFVSSPRKLEAPTLQCRWFYSYSHDVLGRIIEVSRGLFFKSLG